MKIINLNSYHFDAIEYMNSQKLGQYMKIMAAIAQSPYSYYIPYNTSKLKRILNTDGNITGVIDYFLDNKLIYQIGNNLTIPVLIVNELKIIAHKKIKNTIPLEFQELVKSLNYDFETLLPELESNDIIKTTTKKSINTLLEDINNYEA